MHWLTKMVREFLALFVEDGSFAAAILLWLGAVWLIFPRAGVPMRLRGPMLLGGLGLILIGSVMRYTSGRR